jgi:hypothetical protein
MSTDPFEPPKPISTFYVLVPLVVPFACLMLGSRHTVGRHQVETAGLVWIGAAFFLVGVWSGWCAVLWPRFSPAFQAAWRPPSQFTPILLCLIFGVVGGGVFLTNLFELLDR